MKYATGRFCGSCEDYCRRHGALLEGVNLITLSTEGSPWLCMAIPLVPDFYSPHGRYATTFRGIMGNRQSASSSSSDDYARKTSSFHSYLRSSAVRSSSPTLIERPLSPTISIKSDGPPISASTHSSRYSALSPVIRSNSTVSYASLQRIRKIPKGFYLFPTDASEVERLRKIHYLLRTVFKADYLAPVASVLDNGARVLDVGCGPGYWTLEMAANYPRSQFIGIDIVAIQPKPPRNVKFLQCDLNHGLPFENDSFAIRVDQWPHIVRELKRVTKPGGYIELTEPDWNIANKGPVASYVISQVINTFQSRSIDPYVARHIHRYLKREGIKDVKAVGLSLPLQKWGGGIGELMADNMRSLLNSLRPYIPTPSLDGETKVFDALVSNVLEEFEERKACATIRKAFGKKEVLVIPNEMEDIKPPQIPQRAPSRLMRKQL
ncbi:uncharacterized protein VTP21DRAFT_5296 [Calcarisporiella thermophila]|uniref:uncharacterized protein n=1 Tax=Calcarisporiella thermophila TaxID=911321 RepID=UPI0037446D5D